MSTVYRSDAARVGLGYSVEFTLRNDDQLTCEWSPRCPAGRDMRRILKRGVYHRVRDQFIAEVTAALGRSAVVVEILPNQPEGRA
jgi:hypothetical protein